MEPEQMLRVLDVMQTHINNGFEEAMAYIRTGLSDPAEATEGLAAPTRPTADVSGWSPEALDAPLPTGGFREVDQLSDVSYRWPDGNIDDYTQFVVYEGEAGFAPGRYALGYKPNGEMIGFVLQPDARSKRGLTYFQRADDFVTSNELISYIRGGGATGRAGFEPGDPVPAAYEGFVTQPLGDRVFGKWNRLAVVAAADDTETMLRHTVAQAHLRGIL
jgi:hypothetical protein